MQCAICGQEYDQTLRYCPNCGVPSSSPEQPADTAQRDESFHPAPTTPPVPPVSTAYYRLDYNPAPYGQISAPPPVPPGYQPYYVQPKPSATGQIVFSIINMVCGCCGIIGSVLGIIALIFAIFASSEGDYNRAASQLRIAKILNIIGVVTLVISIIVYIALYFGFVFSIMDSSWRFENQFTSSGI